jgi:hypothetical protein
MQTYLFALSNEPPWSSLVLTFAPPTGSVFILRLFDLLLLIQFPRCLARLTDHLDSPLLVGSIFLWW